MRINLIGGFRGTGGIPSYERSLLQYMKRVANVKPITITPLASIKMREYGGVYECDKIRITRGLEYRGERGFINRIDFSEARVLATFLGSWVSTPFVVARIPQNEIKLITSIETMCGLFSYVPEKTSTICYDLFFVHEPVTTKMRIMAKMYPQVIKKISSKGYVFVLSEYVKSQVLELGVDEASVVVVYGGVDRRIFKPRRKSRILREIGFRKYFIHVGNDQPRKNITALLKAFAMFRREVGGYSLIRVGNAISSEFRYRTIKEAKQLGILSDIVFVENATDTQIAELLSNAVAFVFPSHGEGLGLPILEAMACGCPVICSNTTALPEVVGDAGVMVDPMNVDGLFEAMMKMNSEKTRRIYIKKGLERSKKFSWEKTTDKIVKTLEG